jgi:hypothetical protein
LVNGIRYNNRKDDSSPGDSPRAPSSRSLTS